jgi:YadA head domain repeat (2 copies)/YadA-like membrane anchor domain
VATGSVAVGAGASAANGGAAFGDGAVATGTNATAVGPGASATFANSSAFGNGATATAANQMAFGTASNTYRMPGLTSAASLAAQSGPTYIVTTDASGNLAATSLSIPDISSLNANVSALQQNVRLLQENLQHGLNQAYEGTAIAIAMGGAALPDNKRFAVTTNWGNFRGTNAMSLVAQARISDNVVANAGFAGGFQYGGIGSRAGLTFAW